MRTSTAATLAVIYFLVGVIVFLVSWQCQGERDPRFDAPVCAAPEVTKMLAGMAFGSNASGEHADGGVDADGELEPCVSAGQLVLRTSTVPRMSISIPLPEWLAPEALQEALDEVTPAGLFARTGDWYQQADFIGLTGDELAALLPDSADAGYTFSGQRTLLELLGGLPTLEDCEGAFRRDAEVSRALAAVVMLEIPCNAMALTPLGERSAAWSRDFEELERELELRELYLAHALELTTGYAHWSILRRAFVAWGR